MGEQLPTSHNEQGGLLTLVVTLEISNCYGFLQKLSFGLAKSPEPMFVSVFKWFLPRPSSLGVPGSRGKGYPHVVICFIINLFF